MTTMTHLVSELGTRRWGLTLALSLVFLIVVFVPVSMLARFYVRLDLLNDDLGRRDYTAAKVDLEHVTQAYATSRRWGVTWLADRYLLRDVLLQRAAAAYLTGDYQSVVDALKDSVDDPRAAYLLGCAQFRLAQRQYRGSTGADPKSLADRSALLQHVAAEVNRDFERAVRMDPEDRFAYKWNYDLTADADAVKRALEQPETVPADVEQIQITNTAVRRRRG
jgi:hypothetical protein